MWRDQSKQNNNPMMMRFLADALRGNAGNPSWDSMGRPVQQPPQATIPFLQDGTGAPVEDAITKMRREQREALEGAGQQM